MAITSPSALLSALIAGERFPIIKPSATAEGAGTFHSLWKVAGMPPAGANPPAFTAGSGYTPTDVTTGAFPYTNPAWDANLGLISGVPTVSGALIIYDRLWACSGFNTTTLTAQNVTTPGNLPSGRDPFNGADVEPWFEVYTAPGATGANWTVTGVDAAGNSGVTWVYAHPANAETVGQMMAPTGGTAVTRGIRQVTSVTCSASSGTAGDVGVTLLRRLATIPLIANQGFSLDAYALGLPEILDDSCLALMVACSTTSTGNIFGQLIIAKS